MKWKLTQAAIGEPEVDEWDGAADDPRYTAGYSFMRALAEASGDMEELAPGVWYVEKEPGHRGFWI